MKLPKELDKLVDDVAHANGWSRKKAERVVCVFYRGNAGRSLRPGGREPKLKRSSLRPTKRGQAHVE